MSADNKNCHMTREDRIIIETGITNGSSKVAIASTIGKDNSTVGKEIKLHRFISYRSRYTSDCANYAKCKLGRSCDGCDSYEKFKCNRRDRSPGACNGCSKMQSCRYDKYKYSADIAQKDYESTLSEAREGINMTEEEFKDLADKVVPLIKQGQSPYVILTSNPDITLSEKSLYNYIEDGLFREFGVADIDLRVKVKRKMSKKDASKYKKRQDRKFLIGRTYDDYKAYVQDNPDLSVVEMDTVYNHVEGPFMQTFKFMTYSFMLIIYHEDKTAAEMVSGVDLLETILGKELFAKEVAVILTDRGAEFSDAEGIEKEEDGSRRTRVFYCDPMASGEKGSLENKHKEIRYICPKENDLKALGLTDQDKANLMTSHINSMPTEFLKGKTPIEMMKFLCPELFEKLNKFGIEEIDKDKVILKPYLIKD